MSKPIMVDKNSKVEFAAEYVTELKSVLEELDVKHIEAVLGALEEAYQNGKQIFIAGNGGSAATASHMACDLGKSIVPISAGEDVRGMRALSLTDNVAWMTAIANDIGYDAIFSEQLRTLMQPNDVFLVISASGNSPNVVRGAEVAHKMGGKVISFLGFDGGAMKDLSDLFVLVERDHYGFVEDVHMVLDHLITAYFRKVFAGWKA